MFLEERIAKLEREIEMLHAKIDGRDWLQLAELEKGVKEILKSVADDSRIEVRQLIGRSKYAQFASARQVAAWLIQRTTDMSTTQISKVFKWKHHSNVCHSSKAVENRRETEPEFRVKTDAMLARFGTNGKQP